MSAPFVVGQHVKAKYLATDHKTHVTYTTVTAVEQLVAGDNSIRWAITIDAPIDAQAQEPTLRYHVRTGRDFDTEWVSPDPEGEAAAQALNLGHHVACLFDSGKQDSAATVMQAFAELLHNNSDATLTGRKAAGRITAAFLTSFERQRAARAAGRIIDAA